MVCPSHHYLESCIPAAHAHNSIPQSSIINYNSVWYAHLIITLRVVSLLRIPTIPFLRVASLITIVYGMPISSLRANWDSRDLRATSGSIRVEIPPLRSCFVRYRDSSVSSSPTVAAAENNCYYLNCINRYIPNFSFFKLINLWLTNNYTWMAPSSIGLCGWCKFNRWLYQNNRKKCRCIIKCL